MRTGDHLEQERPVPVAVRKRLSWVCSGIVIERLPFATDKTDVTYIIIADRDPGDKPTCPAIGFEYSKLIL